MCLVGHCTTCLPPQNQNDICQEGNKLVCWKLAIHKHFTFVRKYTLDSAELKAHILQSNIHGAPRCPWQNYLHILTTTDICRCFSEQDCPTPFMSNPKQEVILPFDVLISKIKFLVQQFICCTLASFQKDTPFRNSLKVKIKYLGAKAQN